MSLPKTHFSTVWYSTVYLVQYSTHSALQPASLRVGMWNTVQDLCLKTHFSTVLYSAVYLMQYRTLSALANRLEGWRDS